MDNKQIYLAHAPEDKMYADDFSAALRTVGVNYWRESEKIFPGQSWVAEIRNALAMASAIVVIGRSFRNIEERTKQLIVNTVHTGKPVIYVVYGSGGNTRFLDDLDITIMVLFVNDQSSALKTAGDIKRWLDGIVSRRFPTSDEGVSDFLATNIDPSKSESLRPPSDSTIFIAHGHDEVALERLKGALTDFGITPIILRDITGPDPSLFRKFLDIGGSADFAIVILSPDDYGASRLQYDSPGVAERSLQYRSRQNVILELGFFYGRLGWERVLVLERRPDLPFPNFEKPSDLHGVINIQINDNDRWRLELFDWLNEHGFQTTK